MKGYVMERNIKLNELSSRLVETSVPVPKKGEILVDITVQGKHQVKPPFPYNAGTEFSGIVCCKSPIPEGCPFIPGKTRVFGTGLGAFADKIAADWTNCHEVPEGLSDEEAAGLGTTFATTYASLTERGRLKAGETLLVHAGAGGIGISGLQIGKALGAKVIATAGSKEKLDVCLANGADVAINYKEEGWQNKVIAANGGKKVDVVYDPVGMIVPSLKCIAWNGRLIVCGFAGGSIESVPTNLILLKNVEVTGIFWGAYVYNEPETVKKVWRDVLQLFREKRVRSIVYKTVYDGLDKLPDAFEALGSGKSWGKVILRVGHGAHTHSKL